MSQYTPYNIVHLGITAIGAGTLPRSCALCYIWWHDVPLGHVWMDSGGISLQDFRALVAEQVRPAIDHYIAASKRLAAGDWAGLFMDGRNEELDALLATHLAPQQLDAAPSNNEPVSVIICTRNRAAFLDNCIKSLMDGPDNNFELIVVDNAPDDDSTKKVVARYPQARYIPEPRKGLDIARNTGAHNSSHNIIAYTDDDVIVGKDWISKIKKCFNDPVTLAVTGQVIPTELRTKAQYIFERYWGFNKGYKPVTFDYKFFRENKDNGVPVWDIGAGANMAFRKDAFDIAGRFDERLDVGAAGCSGDSEFWYRILAERWSCFYCPQLYVYHNHRDSGQALTNQVFNYMRGQVASLLVQYERYQNRGDLVRLYKILPQYYLRRIKHRLAKGVSEDYETIFTEIKGCISGWFFYKTKARAYKKDILPSIANINNFATVNGQTQISVVITCYNYGRYLARAIDSVMDQAHGNTEIIVVDDGSTDNTQEVLKKYRDVKSIITQRVGASGARNTGISMSTGSLIVFLDADDYLYPDALATNRSLLAANPDYAYVSGAFDRVNDNGDILPNPEPREYAGDNYANLLRGNYIGLLGNVMYRRELFFTFHFDTSLKNCEDYELNLSISRHFRSGSHKQPVIAYRQHPGNKSANDEKMYQTVKKILDKHYAAAETNDIKTAAKQGIKNWNEYYQRKKSTL